MSTTGFEALALLIAIVVLWLLKRTIRQDFRSIAAGVLVVTIASLALYLLLWVNLSALLLVPASWFLAGLVAGRLWGQEKRAFNIGALAAFVGTLLGVPFGLAIGVPLHSPLSLDYEGLVLMWHFLWILGSPFGALVGGMGSQVWAWFQD